MHTVKKVAEMAGVSVRTLHHYDAIGLLRPAHIGANGYRYYDRDALLRLQQILIHRELGIPLAEIGVILDDPGFNRLEALARQRSRIQQEHRRLTGMLRTIDRTIAELKGDRVMKDADLYTGIVDPAKQAEYERWLIERYGPEVSETIEASRRAAGRFSEAEMARAMDDLRRIEHGLRDKMLAGAKAEDQANHELVAAHNAWVGANWGKPCPPEAYVGLADMYLAHPDFVARHEVIAPGFSAWLAAAMKAWAARQPR